MKSPLSTFFFTLAATTLSWADHLNISQITWQADDGGRLKMSGRISTPEGCTVSPLHQRGVLSDGQKSQDDSANLSYSLQGFSSQQNWMGISLTLESIPEDGTIRIDDSLSFHSYQGYELSPAHCIEPANAQDEFTFHGHQYKLALTEGNQLTIQASSIDPAVERFRLLDENGSQITEKFTTGRANISIPYESKPHSLVIVRQKNAQQIDIPLQKDIKITGELLDIAKGRMSSSITPQATQPEEELSTEERELIQNLPPFTLKEWSYHNSNSGNELKLYYKSAKLPQHPFTLLSKDYESYFKLSKSRDKNITGASKYLASFSQPTHKQENMLQLVYRGLDDLELDEDIAITLAYGEVYSKRHEIAMHDRGEIYLKGKTYRYEVKPAEPELAPRPASGITRPWTACNITLSCDQRENILPEQLFFDAEDKALTTHSARNYAGIMNYRGQLSAIPHSIQLRQKAGELKLSARLKTHMVLPTILPITKAALSDADTSTTDTSTNERRIEPTNLSWWRENQEQIKLIVVVPNEPGYEHLICTPFGYVNLPEGQQIPKEDELHANFNHISSSGWTTRRHWLTIVLTKIPESGCIKLKDDIMVKRRPKGSGSEGESCVYTLNLSIQAPKNILAMMKGEAGPVITTEFAEIPKENSKEARKLIKDLQFGLDSWEIDYRIDSLHYKINSEHKLYLRFRRAQSEYYTLSDDSDEPRASLLRNMVMSNALKGMSSTFNHDFTRHDAKQWCNICTSGVELPNIFNYQENMSALVRYNEALSAIHPIDPEEESSFTFHGCEYKTRYDAAKRELLIEYMSPTPTYPQFRVYTENGTSIIPEGLRLTADGHTQFTVKNIKARSIQVSIPQSSMRVNHPIKFQFEIPTMQVGSK